MSATGQCLCGAVRFKAEKVDSHVHACHCSMCQRWNGGPALSVDVGSVSFTGEQNLSRYASSDWAERGFCSQCGSNLFYCLKPDRYIMSTGSFDDHAFEFDGEIFCAEKPDWYDFAGDHPRHDGMPDT